MRSSAHIIIIIAKIIKENIWMFSCVNLVGAVFIALWTTVMMDSNDDTNDVYDNND